MTRAKYVVGIDEVGRGPLAGITTIGAVALLPGFRRNHFDGVRDSKQLSPAAREAWFSVINEEVIRGTLAYAVASTSPALIDARGIVWALERAMRRALHTLALDPSDVLLLLDGGLRAPATYPFSKTIIRGDETELPISLASIVAKVTRDRKMERLARKYPIYGFEVHKGYGTAFHRNMIRRHGPCEIHRLSYLRNIVY
jgi:ribonuclease HII